MSEDRRCRRGKLCAGREKVVTGRTTGWESCTCTCHGRTDTACDEDGGCGHLHTEPADTHVWAGKLLETAQGMCWSCTGRLGLALDELAGGELLARLALEHEPSLEIQYRTVDITSSDPLYPALVINEHAEALSSLLAYELDTQAWFVADDAGLTDSGEWDARLAAMSREGSRIVAAALLLRHRLDQWLALPVQDYPARSLGIQPQDGLNPDHVYQDEGEWRVRRDGLDAANVILDLHFKISRFTGGAPSDHVPVPCGYCSNRTLRRDHESGVVRCRTCGDTKTDDGYDAFLTAALAVHEANPAA